MVSTVRKFLIRLFCCNKIQNDSPVRNENTIPPEQYQPPKNTRHLSLIYNRSIIASNNISYRKTSNITPINDDEECKDETQQTVYH